MHTEEKKHEAGRVAGLRQPHFLSHQMLNWFEVENTVKAGTTAR